MFLEESLEYTQERIVGSGAAMEASKRRRSKIDYRIQQHSKGSSEGSGTILEVLDEPKENSGSSSNSISGSDDEVQDISSDEENKTKDGNDAEKQAGEEEPLDAQAGGEQVNVQVPELAAPNTSSSLTLSSAEYKIQSMVDVPIHQEDTVVQGTLLVDIVISMVTE
ncbi:hypothetical protein Tco_0600434 [Tanacetum coccineum]|uniref:Uncharacterized protein n=1 Tax=Tanacetum coccineum TaxID=301880 RepID=A0ABQ4WBQ8_9ASTR